MGLSLEAVREKPPVGFIKKKKRREREADVKGISNTISDEISHAALS